MGIEFGLDTFGDITRDAGGKLLTRGADDPQRRGAG